MVLQVLLDPVVVDKRVVHVDEKDDRMKSCHAAPPARLNCTSGGLGERPTSVSAKELIGLIMRTRHVFGKPLTAVEVRHSIATAQALGEGQMRNDGVAHH